MPKPLQAGDHAPNYSRTDNSMAADRRSQPEYENPIEEAPGGNAAQQSGAPMDNMWRPGQLAPNRFLSAPFTATESPEGCETTCQEIDIYQYGDCYDPHSPMRVVDVTSKWKVDTDYDGHPN